jgi:DNA segregation ATPase FtsK/SpoIIIE, S-DNA-T family
MSESDAQATGEVGERLELRVSVHTGEHLEDLLVDASTSDRVGDLAKAAAEYLNEVPQASLWCERRGEALNEGLPLGEAGIRWGDRLMLARVISEPTRIGGTARVELVITGGPCAGQRWELGDGSYQLGRDPSSAICVLDPSLSRRHLEVVVKAAGVSVADAGSSNGTAINGEALPAHSLRAVREGEELELGRTLLRIRPLQASGEHSVAQRDGRLDFNRPPRVTPTITPFSRELDAPPSKGRKARLPIAASLVPVAAGLLLFLLLKSPVMLAVAGLSPIMAISTFVSDRRGGKKSFARESTEFRAKLQNGLEELDAALEQEMTSRRAESPDAPTLIARLGELAPSVWERRPEDADFLRLRLGVADLPARSRLCINEGGERDIRAEAEGELIARAVIASVPLTLDVRSAGVVGLAGPRVSVSGLARWLVLQAAILHSPGELVVMAALTPSSADEWSFLKWLPHLRPDRVGLQAPPLTVGRRHAEELLAEIRDLARQRRTQARAPTGPSARPAQLLLLIDEDTEVDRALLTAALTGAAEHGIAVIWIGRNSRDLPGQTGAIVEIEEGRSILKLTDVASGESTAGASAESLAEELAASAARALAPIRDISELARSGDIPRRVGLLDLLDLLPPTPEALQQRWTDWRGELKATVGVGADGVLTLDLPTEGPHALIAGTTGSGKSELLRTFVAAAAAAAPPHRLCFLLVDYKGGAAFAPCSSLPHVVDIVSDLDEHLADRALISLRAELKRRERVLAEYGAKDLLELSRREPDRAPPILVIAVDEFAKLREEVPEFVDGVVDIAQRGRSLGVHMVLAAQTLRNAFTPAIRANTNLRLALRVAEESESEDMIGSPLAARIPSGENSRGRVYVRTGVGELRELQAAYVSGRSDQAEAGELRVESFDLASDRPQAIKTSGADSDSESDLVSLGEAARAAQSAMKLPIPAPPWMPVLPTLLSLDRVPSQVSGAANAGIGIVDLPELQRQDPLVVDLEAGHVAIFGAGNSGKTTALQTFALSVARTASPRDLCMYALDAASGKLAPLAALPHCAGVVMADEEERVHRLLRVLCQRVERRGKQNGDAGKVVLLLDDIGSFAHHYDKPGLDSPFQLFERLLAGGRAAGVHIMLTASRRGALPSALAAHVAQRLVLRMASEEELLSLGLDAKTVRGAKLPPGRGFTPDSHEFQIAVPVSDGVAQPLVDAMDTVPGERQAWAPPIESLPTHVGRETITAEASLNCLPVGLADADLNPANIDLSELHMLVVGPYRSGRSTALETICLAIDRTQSDAELHLLAPRRSSLRDTDLWTSVARTHEQCEQSVERLLGQLEAGDFEKRPIFLVIDDAGELSDMKIVGLLERLVRVARDSSMRVIAAIEVGSARGIGVGWIREIRREGHGLLLQPDLAADGDLLAARLPRRLAVQLTPGRGFLVLQGTADLIQVAS